VASETEFGPEPLLLGWSCPVSAITRLAFFGTADYISVRAEKAADNSGCRHRRERQADAHLADLFKHKFNGGTHQFDIHEYLVLEDHDREFGYELV